MHYYQFNIGDYASSTQHLEPMEDLAYRRMLDLYYSKELPLPKDVEQVARLIRMRTHCDCIAVVLDEFFTKEKDGWHNKGADKALSKVYKKSEAAKKSAAARWNKNKDLSECERNANASKTQCEDGANGMLPNTQYPIPNTQKEKKVSTSLDYSSWPAMPSEQLFKDWKALRTRLKANVTQTVINRTSKELHAAVEMGFTVDQCFEQWIYKGWRGFEAKWMRNAPTKMQSQGVNHIGTNFEKPEGWA
ncbi:protein of unknown function DUF1376 [Vibrio phage 1.052.A._10N.286.46.C3]|nr:protein of unknown function DUF1376 [Vibrio phage 1.052.A._10N.286.46.C3]